MTPYLRPEMLFVSATKGIENDTFLRMSEVICEVLAAAPNGFAPRLASLSGPSFAKEVAKGDPTAITCASRDAELSATIQPNSVIPLSVSIPTTIPSESNSEARSRTSSPSPPESSMDSASDTTPLLPSSPEASPK